MQARVGEGRATGEIDAPLRREPDAGFDPTP